MVSQMLVQIVLFVKVLVVVLLARVKVKQFQCPYCRGFQKEHRLYRFENQFLLRVRYTEVCGTLLTLLSVI